MSKIMSADDAVALLKDNDTLCIVGFIGSVLPQELTNALERRFLTTGSPRDLTLHFCTGSGDGATQGENALAHEGLLKRIVGGHFGLVPKLQQMIAENKVEGYNLPLGTIGHLYRDIAGGRIGTLTHVGLKTFVDPRLEGGKMNERTKEDLVELVEIAGTKRLLYKAQHLDVAFLRATVCDEDGNFTMDKEASALESLALAEAVHNQGGKVIVQAETIVQPNTIDARRVKVPGILVDAIVQSVPENHMQTYVSQYNPAFSGECRVPVDSMEPMPLNERKVIARRSAMELIPGAIINLGIGVPEGISNVANEEGLPGLKLTVEAGGIGGFPSGGNAFGAVTNPDCIIDLPSMFDFYDGGGLGQAFLGLAQCDRFGNINVSRFGPKIAGCGGFINITQNTKNVVYCGSFTAGGLKVAITDGRLQIVQEGRVKKFINDVEQVTFSAEYAKENNQNVMYITERAVFRLIDGVLTLTEIAPGIDLQKDILEQMEFVPAIAADLKTMDERLFRTEKMGLSQH